MIKTTLRTLIDSAPALGILAAQPVPARASYRLGKIVNSVDHELRAYDAARIATCQRYGPLKNNHYDIPDERKGEFEAELEALKDVEVQIDYAQIPLSLIDSASVPASVMAALEWLIVEDQASQNGDHTLP